VCECYSVPAALLIADCIEMAALCPSPGYLTFYIEDTLSIPKIKNIYLPYTETQTAFGVDNPIKFSVSKNKTAI